MGRRRWVPRRSVAVLVAVLVLSLAALLLTRATLWLFVLVGAAVLLAVLLLMAKPYPPAKGPAPRVGGTSVDDAILAASGGSGDAGAGGGGAGGGSGSGGGNITR